MPPALRMPQALGESGSSQPLLRCTRPPPAQGTSDTGSREQAAELLLRRSLPAPAGQAQYLTPVTMETDVPGGLGSGGMRTGQQCQLPEPSCPKAKGSQRHFVFGPLRGVREAGGNFCSVRCGEE